ncbi:dockerin type I domain-containing protein [Herbivorax sp. ANBcel31]|uniref:dockerin type I domain-containing protein n=1 Tax=Herbivorax sp. ANBcel31 TaxID=3069754 RepID=UPI0027ADB204|nr:dockerin type I domain-containing protein [Herbivorax sp. ANBcel31]MDQ2086827.1 dockerin type I domain-containing protein [Herbivorax sp. ANBcel31]
MRVWQRTIANAGFETGSLHPWYSWNDAEVVNNNQRSGNYALRIGDAPSSAEQVVVVEPNTTYEFSGYGKVPEGQEVLIGVKDYGGSQIVHPIRGTDYTEGSVTFTTGEDNTSATVFFYRDGGTGYAYGDDFSLRVKSAHTEPEPDIMIGDLNGDGIIDSSDYVLLSRYLLEIIDEFPVGNIEAADINGDGVIDSADYVLLGRYLLELVDEIPVF